MRYYEIKSYKYMLAADFEMRVPKELTPKTVLHVGPYVSLDTEGMLRIRTGYMWDGASGPAIDTHMESPLVHDAFYELCRAGKLPLSKRKAIDKLFHRMLRAEGMNSFRARYHYWGVRIGGRSSARPQKSKKYKIYIG